MRAHRQLPTIPPVHKPPGTHLVHTQQGVPAIPLLERTTPKLRSGQTPVSDHGISLPMLHPLPLIQPLTLSGIGTAAGPPTPRASENASCRPLVIANVADL